MQKQSGIDLKRQEIGLKSLNLHILLMRVGESRNA